MVNFIACSGRSDSGVRKGREREKVRRKSGEILSMVKSRKLSPKESLSAWLLRWRAVFQKCILFLYQGTAMNM